MPFGGAEDDMEPSDVIGVVKIKDGLFICDEYGAQVSLRVLYLPSSPFHTNFLR